MEQYKDSNTEEELNKEENIPGSIPQDIAPETSPEICPKTCPEICPETAPKAGDKLSLWDRFTQIPPVKKLLEIPAVAKVLNKETVLYVFVGVLTTLVDYVVFALVNELLKRGGVEVETSSTLATAVAWVAAVVFAYFTNKIYVFESRDWETKSLVREIAQFFGARAVSGLITLLLMWLLVGWHMNEYLAKILTSVFNMVFNYVASKLLIFKKKD